MVRSTPAVSFFSSKGRDAPNRQRGMKNHGRPEAQAGLPQSEAGIRQECRNGEIVEQHRCHEPCGGATLIITPLSLASWFW